MTPHEAEQIKAHLQKTFEMASEIHVIAKNMDVSNISTFNIFRIQLRTEVLLKYLQDVGFRVEYQEEK
jgi:hypothetical protein